MKIKTIIIDDEQNNIDNLVAILHTYFPEVEVIETADGASAGLAAIRTLRPELVFLDVEMPEFTGIELLRQLGSINFDVVFVSAHGQYAVNAFRLSALDFLLKPIDLQDLEECLEKVKAKRGDADRVRRLEEFVEHYQPTSGGAGGKRVPLPTAERLLFVPIQEIIRCEGHKNYTTFYLDSGERVVVSKTLKEYEMMLKEYDFIRVHQSHVVNKEHIKKYVKSDGGYLVMSDNSDVPIARGRKEAILGRLSEF